MGNYNFTSLTAGQLQWSSSSRQPNGYTVDSSQTQWLQPTPPTATHASGLTGCYIASTRATRSTPAVDAGLYQKASLGDYVWVDSNNDGIQNDGEPPA